MTILYLDLNIKTAGTHPPYSTGAPTTLGNISVSLPDSQARLKTGTPPKSIVLTPMGELTPAALLGRRPPEGQLYPRGTYAR